MGDQSFLNQGGGGLGIEKIEKVPRVMETRYATVDKNDNEK